MAECLLNLKETYIQVQEAQSVPNKINLNRATPRHIIIKVTKIKDEKIILKAAREKQLYTREPPYTIDGFLKNISGQERIDDTAYTAEDSSLGLLSGISKNKKTRQESLQFSLLCLCNVTFLPGLSGTS